MIAVRAPIDNSSSLTAEVEKKNLNVSYNSEFCSLKIILLVLWKSTPI